MRLVRPLACHCVGNSLKSLTALFPAVRAWCHAVNPGFAPVNNIGRFERRQILEPQTGRFSLAVPKLPRLDNLIRLADLAANDADGVFDADSRDRRIHQQPDKI